MGIKYSNNAKTTLSAGINDSVTSAAVASGAVFPALSGGDYFYATIETINYATKEIVKVTARSGNTLTIVRAQDNTSAAAFSSGDFIELRVTAAVLEDATEPTTGITAGTVIASKAIITDSNKDITGGRNITISGELDAGSLDVSGDADIDGTLEADAITLGGTALGSLYSPIAGSSSITTVGTIGAGAWQGTAVADTYVANDLTISGGTVNNSVIGGTSAAAGTFTDLSATGNVILGDASGDSVTFNAATATIPNNLDFSGTGTVKMPVGTTAQRPTGAAGMFRYNSTTGKFEGYTAAWGSVGGGATGGGSDEVFVENSDDVTVDYTITSGKNAMSVGPITVASGVAVTIPSGSRWVIL